MDKLNRMIEEFRYIADSPKEMLGKYLAEGKTVVGCLPVYTPAELVHAGGMVPMGLWGGQLTPVQAGKYNPAFTCSIMRSCLEYGMNGDYEGLSCVLLPILCDTFRGMVSSWRAGTSIPLVAMIHPQNRADPGAREFLVQEYGRVRGRLQELTGREITDEALESSIEVYNRHATLMTEFAALANDHLDVITPANRHAVMKSAQFEERDRHADRVAALIEELKARPVYAWPGKKVVLSGITAEPDSFLEMFSENNIAVVGDDLAQESRQYRTLIPAGDTPLERLAAQWFERAGCSMIHETHPERDKMLVRLAKENGADAVAVCLMRFCDVEEYDYPYISKGVEAAGLACLCLEIDQSTQDNEQSRTKIQSFAEI